MTSTASVKAHMEGQKAKGLKELRRLWAYPQDEQQIRQLVAKINQRTARALARHRKAETK